MSNSGDILLRGGALLKKYQHYLPDEEMAPLGPKGEKVDQYASLFYSLRHNLRDIQEKAESIKEETNRAALATALFVWLEFECFGHNEPADDARRKSD